MINYAKDSMDKVDRVEEQMGNVSTEMKILRKNQKEMWRQKTLTKMGLLADQTQLRKESLSLGHLNRNLKK